MDFVALIIEKKIDEAYAAAKALIESRQTNLNADKCWVKIYEDGIFEESDIVINRELLPEDFHQTIRIYICLAAKNWDESKLAELRKAVKLIIAMVSREWRVWLNERTKDFWIDPGLRVFLQDLIHHFSARKLFEDKADACAVKAQFSGTLLQCGMIKKHEFGNDMLQYADSYAYLGLNDQALQMYLAVINDFNTGTGSPFKTAFPEVQFVNDNTAKENEVLNNAKEKYEALNAGK